MIIYDIKNRPRYSKKTVELRRKAIEKVINDTTPNKIIIYISMTTGQQLENERLFNAIGIDNIKCFSPSFNEAALRGIMNHNIYIFLDEPFLYPVEEQSKIIKSLEVLSSRNNIEVVGCGTKPEKNFYKFEDFIL